MRFDFAEWRGCGDGAGKEASKMNNTTALEIGSDLWNARVYAGLSAASELAAGLHRPSLAAFSLLSAWKVYWRLGKLNRELDEIFKGYDKQVPFPPVVPGELISGGWPRCQGK